MMQKMARRLAQLTVLTLSLAACGIADEDGQTTDSPADAEAPADDDSAANGEGESASNGEDAEFQWQWEHALALPGTAYDELLSETLPEMLESGTDGRLSVEVIYGQTDPHEAIESVQAGRFDGTGVALTYYASNYPIWTLSEVGFVLHGFDDYEQMMRNEPGQFISDDFEEQTGLMHLGGTVAWTTSAAFTNVPLETVEDWEGLRIRAASMESENTLAAFGASPVTMPFGDIYSALERGTIDGFQTPINAAASLNVWEVTDYINLWPITEGGVFPAVNPESFQELPEDVQEQVRDVFEEFREVAWERTRADNDAFLDRFEEEGMTRVEPSEEVVAELEAAVGQQLLDDWLDRTGDRGEELLSLMEGIEE